MPSNLNPPGALPARFRRARVLIVGCGDVGQRVLRQLVARLQVLVLTSSPPRVPALRAGGARPLVGNLDQPSTLRRLAGLASRVLHLAPPPSDAGAPADDPRTRALVRALWRRRPPRQLVYGSTSGVYGDCKGVRVNETRTPRPQSLRARRRLDAERAVRHLGRVTGVRASILRIPGIYAPDRAGGTPRERLLQGTPVLLPPHDVYTSHIHADDLARCCVAALFRGRSQRIVNCSDDTQLRAGDYMDLAADLYGLPRPPRISRQEAQRLLPAQRLAFLSESRRLDNTRLKRELRVRLHHPSVRSGLMERVGSATAG